MCCLEDWDCGFESHSRHGLISACFCIIFQCRWSQSGSSHTWNGKLWVSAACSVYRQTDRWTDGRTDGRTDRRRRTDIRTGRRTDRQTDGRTDRTDRQLCRMLFGLQSFVFILCLSSRCVMNLRVPQNSGSFLTSWEPVSFSRRTLLHGVNN